MLACLQPSASEVAVPQVPQVPQPQPQQQQQQQQRQRQAGQVQIQVQVPVGVPEVQLHLASAHALNQPQTPPHDTFGESQHEKPSAVVAVPPSPPSALSPTITTTAAATAATSPLTPPPSTAASSPSSSGSSEPEDDDDCDRQQHQHLEEAQAEHSQNNDEQQSTNVIRPKLLVHFCNMRANIWDMRKKKLKVRRRSSSAATTNKSNNTEAQVACPLLKEDIISEELLSQCSVASSDEEQQHCHNNTEESNSDAQADNDIINQRREAQEQHKHETSTEEPKNSPSRPDKACLRPVVPIEVSLPNQEEEKIPSITLETGQEAPFSVEQGASLTDSDLDDTKADKKVEEDPDEEPSESGHNKPSAPSLEVTSTSEASLPGAAAPQSTPRAISPSLHSEPKAFMPPKPLEGEDESASAFQARSPILSSLLQVSSSGSQQCSLLPMEVIHCSEDEEDEESSVLPSCCVFPPDLCESPLQDVFQRKRTHSFHDELASSSRECSASPVIMKRPALATQQCSIPVLDLFQRSPLGSIRCVGCSEPHDPLADGFTIDLKTETMEIVCSKCSWWTSRKIGAKTCQLKAKKARIGTTTATENIQS